MNKNKSIGLNAIFNGIRTTLQALFPLITYPYITSVLQVENMGKYNFSSSFVSYFSLLAGLGVSTYAIREGAKIRNNKENLSEFASEVYTINIISMFISYILLAVLVLSVPILKKYESIIFTLSIGIAFNTIGCDWIYSIYEEYIYITIRSILVQIFSIILMFLFVKSRNDLLIYAFTTVAANSGAGIINRIGLKKYCILHFSVTKSIKKHLRQILVLFANNLATTIYVSADTIILGFLATDYNVGIYSISTKIYFIIKNLLSAIIIVSVPRLSFFWGNNQKKEFNQLSARIINLLIALVFPAMTGLFMLSKNIILLISNASFLSAVSSLRLLCIALLFSLFSWFFTSCILIPTKNEDIVLWITLISSMINIILNILLIPLFQENAAAFTTVVAEGISMLLTFIVAKREYNGNINASNLISTLFGCAVIIIICTSLGYLQFPNIIILTLSIAISIIMYAFVLRVFKNPALGIALSIIKNKN